MKILPAYLYPTISALVAMSSEPVAGVQNTGFTGSCAYPGLNFSRGHLLGLFCLNTDTSVYGYNYTCMDLDQCVGNNDGVLVGYNKGNFSSSCTDCTVSLTQPVSLSCACASLKGVTARTRVQLDTFVFNNNGALDCYGNLGVQSWEGPCVPSSSSH
ncbi:hypothetical protein P8C59_004202 [Phyllachora maydis]|uniref:Cyanovirin-N domain-containing protein n=1 Tax=Phyllachora maydis TaxID=1825666 RepID=A0AAD9MC76_9PEZI|nr:hypothetical protein P8C59_004202 [Phyllachora maydis]